MLKTGAILNFMLAIGHVLCLFRLDVVFRLYRIDPIMDRLASCWPPIPYLMTLGVACGLAGCGFYALSAAGTIRPLPLLRPIVYAIGGLFLLRALVGFIAMGSSGSYPITELSAAVVAGVVDTLYLAGGIRTFNHTRA